MSILCLFPCLKLSYNPSKLTTEVKQYIEVDLKVLKSINHKMNEIFLEI